MIDDSLSLFMQFCSVIHNCSLIPCCNIMPDNEEDVDFFPSTSGDGFESPEGSEASSKSDNEMLLELEARQSNALKKKQSGNKVTS